MNKRSWAVAAVLTGGALALAGLLVGARAADVPAKDAPKESPSRDVFGISKVWALHLEIGAKEFAAMQPPGGGMGFPGGFGGPGKPPDKPAAKPGEPARDSDRSAFGVEFPWVRAEFTVDGQTYRNVGIRYKGNSTYMATARSLKRSFKIELDHYDDTLRFHGLKTLNLHCEVMDPTRGREVLAYAVFRAAGVPAPRTAYAEVTLTVPGKYDREYVGLYTLVEQVDRTFLKERFKNNKGLLMKPERVRGLDYLGEDWEKYISRYQPKHTATKEEARRVIDFVRLVNRGDDEQFRKEIDSYLDVELFLRFMAANALVVNMDSFFTLGHNYYLYLNPETKKFVFIPWDLDLALGNFAMMGSPDQLLDLSLTRPYAGGNRLTDRLLAIKEVGEKYQQIVKELATTCFTKERLLKDVEAIEKATKGPVAREAKAVAARKEGMGGFGFGPPGGGMFGRSSDLRSFVEKRTASVAAQLAGKSKGYVPAAMGFGPGGPGGPGGRPGGGFGPGGFLTRPLLDALDSDRDSKVTKDELLAGARRFFAECDKDKKGAVDEKTLADGLNRLFPRPPGFGPPGGGGVPRGGRPGAAAASEVVKRTGTDSVGKVTLDRFLAAAETLFRECDRDNNGSLDEKEIGAGIGLLLPPPPVRQPEGPKPEGVKEGQP